MEVERVRSSGDSQAIVSEFRRRIRALGHAHGDRIHEKAGENWIGWRSTRHGRTFAEMRPLQERVQVFILPTKRGLKDPSRLAKRNPPTQGWGYFLSRFEVRTLDEVEPAFQLIRQTYELGANGAHGRGPRARARRRQIV